MEVSGGVPLQRKTDIRSWSTEIKKNLQELGTFLGARSDSAISERDLAYPLVAPVSVDVKMESNKAELKGRAFIPCMISKGLFLLCMQSTREGLLS